MTPPLTSASDIITSPANHTSASQARCSASRSSHSNTRASSSEETPASATNVFETPCHGDVIQPAIQELRAEGLDIQGPVPADTAFTPGFLQTTDVIVAMYHDQGLPVVKHVGFGNAVNVTLGLPILRTSVDHGTALSLARSGKADAGSLRAALALAIELASSSTSQ